MRMKEKFKVLHPFRDLEDTNKTFPNGREYTEGDLYPSVYLDLSEERVEELSTKKNKIGRPLIERIEEVEDEVGEE